MTDGQLPAVLDGLLRRTSAGGAGEATDAELLERFALGREESAFVALMQRHGRMVWGVCRHVLRHEQDAEDAFQATFLVLARKAGSIRKGTAVASWLHGTAYHIATRARRDAATRRSHETKGATMPQAEAASDTAWREVLAVLDEEVQKLPPRQRAAFVLCSLESKRLAEAARQLGWKEGTLSGTLSRAREQLRQRLARRGVTLSAVLAGLALSREPSAPAAVAERTFHSALAFATGETAPTLTPQVASLVREATRSLAAAKLPVAAVVLVAVIAAAGVTGFPRQQPENREGSGEKAARREGQASPERDPRERADRYGDPLPPGAVARLGTSRLRHGDGRALAFSKDGKRLISCNFGGEVRVWDVATGKLIRRTRLAGEAREHILHSGVALARYGATAQAWDGQITYLYDTATGQERGRLPNTFPLGFSSDGETIVVQARDKEKNGPVQLWHIDGLKKVLNLDLPPGIALSETPFAIASRLAAFTSDGKQLAVVGGARDKAGSVGAGNNELFVWDTTTGKLRQRNKCRAAMCSLAYSPDGSTLAAGLYGEGEAILFEASTLKEKATLPARKNVKSTKFAPVSLAGFSPDGRLLVGGCWVDGLHLQEDRVLIWDLTGTKTPRRLPDASPTSAFALAPDGKTVASCWTNLQYGGGSAIDLIDVASGRRLHHLPGHDTPVEKLAVSPDGKILATGDYKSTIRLWDATTGKPLRSLAGWDEFASACLVFSTDGQRLVSVSRKGKLQMWEVDTGKELSRFAIDSPSEGVYPGYTVAFLGDGKRLAAVGSRMSSQLSIWDVATGEQRSPRLLSAVQPTPSTGRTELAPDGETATVWRGDRLTIEDISTENLLATLPRSVGNPLGFSADGRLLVVFLLPRTEHLMAWAEPKPVWERYDVKGLSVIETASGQEVVRLDVRQFDHVAFTPDGRALVVTDRQKLSVWDAATGERLHQMAWPETIRDAPGRSKIQSLIALPGGRAATGMSEGDILVWDLALSTWLVRRPAREQFDALWSDLTRDAGTAYRAVSSLTAAPAWSVPLLGTHLHPVAVDGKRIDKLLADLEDERYDVREAASRELSRLRFHAEPLLRRRLEGSPSLEMRRRLEAILAEPNHPPAEALRTLRAIAVLERIGTPEARKVLERLAGGAAARETREAKAALKRLAFGANPQQ